MNLNFSKKILYFILFVIHELWDHRSYKHFWHLISSGNTFSFFGGFENQFEHKIKIFG